MAYEESDELSFGGEREPRLRIWAAAHRRLLAITVAAAVVPAGPGAARSRTLLGSCSPPAVALRSRAGLRLG
ncbi:hypothetical protein ACIBF6_20260 [Streptosporangium amethystogenes]|uniref:hypothetical protein n=1 Tax=Streptosporangium amethystogenes TaxID=2002 RepID=UPI0037B114FA